MKNNIANAYMGQKAAQKMISEEAEKPVQVKRKEKATLISAIMLRNGVGGTLETNAQVESVVDSIESCATKAVEKQGNFLINLLRRTMPLGQ